MLEFLVAYPPIGGRRQRYRDMNSGPVSNKNHRLPEKAKRDGRMFHRLKQLLYPSSSTPLSNALDRFDDLKREEGASTNREAGRALAEQLAAIEEILRQDGEAAVTYDKFHLELREGLWGDPLARLERRLELALAMAPKPRGLRLDDAEIGLAFDQYRAGLRLQRSLLTKQPTSNPPPRLFAYTKSVRQHEPFSGMVILGLYGFAAMSSTLGTALFAPLLSIWAFYEFKLFAARVDDGAQKPEMIGLQTPMAFDRSENFSMLEGIAGGEAA